jgi:hypothetical protein
LRRRAAAIGAGESLALVFADGEAPAVAAGGRPVAKGKKPKPDQGSLF